jgi:ubiquinone/menaquinone biosynthesis C-methylase UbiE
MDDTKDIRLHRAILNELGYDINSQSMILDFGCGEGKRVCQYRNAGFNAYGVDIKLDGETDFLRLILTANRYHIPYSDETFDFVFSESVFEHVQTHSSALYEIWRILKPGGFSLHFFPPKWKLLEAHVSVPLAGALQGYLWLLFWASLGVRDPSKKGLESRQEANRNYDYLISKTHYISKKMLSKYVTEHFPTIIFAERYLIKHSYGRARSIYPLIKIFPFISSLYSSLHWRVIFFRKQLVSEPPK